LAFGEASKHTLRRFASRFRRFCDATIPLQRMQWAPTAEVNVAFKEE
jgi:hypothetical protein